MASITRTNPSGMHTPFANYRHTVVATGAQKLVFIAGQVPADAQGNVLPPDSFEAQVDLVMTNVERALAEAGARLADVAKVTIYIVNQSDTQKGRAILGRYFGATPPASTLVVARGLANPSFLVEIEAIAVL